MSEFLGIENSAVKFVIAFVLVMALIGLTAWLIRQFSSARPNSAGGRSRQPRLAVLDSAVVDARRRLVLIRRDNVEHLLMIGGPTDVVVEANVVRAQHAMQPGPRMAPQRAPIEQIEPDYDPSLVPFDEPYYEEPPAPAPRPARERPAPAVRAPAPAPQPAPAQASPHAAQHAAQHVAPPAPRVQPAPQRSAPPVTVAPPRTQPQYSEMAHRLEAALRMPPEMPAAQQQPVEPRMPPPPAKPAPALSVRNEPQPPAPKAAPDADAKPGDVFSSLEEEMANLLKPGGKDPA